MGNHVWELVSQLRANIEAEYQSDRARSLALTKLDECGLWLGECAENSDSA